MKVLHVLGPIRPSGMERMLASAAPHFVAAELESHVFGQWDASDYSETLRRAGYVLHVTDGKGNRALRDLVRTLRRERYDVVHIHTEGNYLATVVAVALASKGDAKLIRTIHNIFDAKGTWYAKRRLQAIFADRLLFELTAPSDDVAQHEKKFNRRPRVIYNWVDDRFFDVRKRRRREHSVNAPVALMVGNCSTVKRHELALAAALSLGHQVVHLGIETGASDEERALLDQLTNIDALRAHGVQDPADYMVSASYFLMPSAWEGMGVALAEALVAGLPAVVSDAPGLQWARRCPGVVMVPPTVDAWTSAIENLRGRSARSECPYDFSAARGASEYLSLYNS